MKKSLSVAVIGLGRIGRVHLENLLFRFPQVNVQAVADPDPESRSFATNLGIKEAFADYTSLLDHADVEAVLLCSPTDTHATYVQAFAQAGKHIFCEKPLDLDIKTIQRVKAGVEESGIQFMLGFNRRFDPQFQSIRARVAAGDIGDPHLLKITSRDPGPPPISYIKVSGGIFLDMAIHDFDMARFIIGKEVVEVYARGAVRVDPAIGEAGDIDTAITTLTFEDGTLAVVDNSRQAIYGYDQRLEVFGSGGMAHIENVFPYTEQYWDASGGHQGRPYHFFMDRYVESYFREIEAFVSCIQSEEQPPVDAHDGLMATAIGLAAGISVKENRPVRIGEILGEMRTD